MWLQPTVKKTALNWQEREKINLLILYEHKQSHTFHLLPPGEVCSKVIITRGTVKNVPEKTFFAVYRYMKTLLQTAMATPGHDGLEGMYRPPALTKTAHSHTADNKSLRSALSQRWRWVFLRKHCARLLFLAPECLRGSNQTRQDDANFVQTVTSGGGVGLIWKQLKV